jgi:hypothetical protein
VRYGEGWGRYEGFGDLVMRGVRVVEVDLGFGGGMDHSDMFGGVVVR